MQTDWVESIEIFGEWGARALEQARADAEWQGWIEEGERCQSDATTSAMP